MNSLVEFLPALLFFAAYIAKGIYVATAVLIVALFAVVAFYWFKDHRLHKLYLITAIVAGIFGGLTLYLRDPWFIKLKPTIAYGLIAAIFLGSHFIGERVLLARIPQKAIRLPDPVWRRVNLAWVVFFAFCAILNLYIALNFSESVWVNFNVFGFTALTFVFLLAHAPFLMRYLADDPAAK